VCYNIPVMLGKKISALKEKVTSKTASAKEQKAQHLVGLDIGTEFVKALIARVNGDQLTIVGTGRVRQHLADMQAGAIADISAVVANCEQALSQAEASAGVSARSVVIGIAGELVQGITTTVRVKRKDANKPLDIAEIDKMIRLIQERAGDKAKIQLARETGGRAPDLKLVNSALVSIDIDGYKVTNPIGFQGKEMTVQLYTAFAPQIHIGALEKCASELDLDLVAVAAEPFGVARSVIGNDPNASMSAILVDIGGGTTDIAVVNEGGVEGTKMFGIGGRVFTKSIEREFGVDYVQAEALKVGLLDGRTPTVKREAVEGALRKTLSIWTSGVELALGEFSKLDHLPNRILLCGGGASLEMLRESLEKSDWWEDLPFTKKPTVQLIAPGEVVSIVDSTGDVDDHTYITAMGLLRVGADSLGLFEIPSGSIRERLNKLLSV
jgi:cell division protein FtsA